MYIVVVEDSRIWTSQDDTPDQQKVCVAHMYICSLYTCPLGVSPTGNNRSREDKNLQGLAHRPGGSVGTLESLLAIGRLGLSFTPRAVFTIGDIFCTFPTGQFNVVVGKLSLAMHPTREWGG